MRYNKNKKIKKMGQVNTPDPQVVCNSIEEINAEMLRLSNDPYEQRFNRADAPGGYNPSTGTCNPYRSTLL